MGKSATKQKKLYKSREGLGQAPGTIRYVGQKKGGKGSLVALQYDASTFKRSVIETVSELKEFLDTPEVTWIVVRGLWDVQLMAKLGELMDIGPLVMEDIVNTTHRPKINFHEDFIFGIFKMVYLDENDAYALEHIAMILMKNTVILFQESEKPLFTSITERIKNKTGIIRDMGADYLFFAHIDIMIDHYFVVAEEFESRVTGVEGEILSGKSSPETVNKIQQLKKDALRYRKWAAPTKDIVYRLMHAQNDLITPKTKTYLTDIHDHAYAVNDDMHVYQEMSMNLMDTYMSSISNKMNEVMKVLTIMSSIFIPITFIAGIYGMNFEIPELHWQNGYYFVLALMLLIILLMLRFFRKRGWL